jgi:hypothetical protein
MKRGLQYCITTSLLLFAGINLHAQVSFKTLVPQESIIEGESFQVQYIIEDGDQVTSFEAPDFRGFSTSAGPYLYFGSKSFKPGKKVRNTVYTLTALHQGRFVIRGALAVINGHTYTSNDVIIQVISRLEAAKRARKEIEIGNPEYFLRPGEDPYEKIRKNLFIKVNISKRTCFVGEPVVATYKLYSRLESRSDIVKNPGFYGFTVYDMISLSDHKSSTEMINGKMFDVHTIRQVQLYPLREGQFVVDGMEVKNSVEFSRSLVNKKTEQEIMEGVLQSNDDFPSSEGSEIFESTTNTEPVTVTVKPLPAHNRPDSFNGATGRFSLYAHVVKDKLARNEQGVIELAITGEGNFTQLYAPSIKWPDGIEGFEPVISDSLDKTKAPLAGTRIFRYAFISVNPGKYILPSVSFSYFNPDTGNYKTVSTQPIEIYTNNEKAVVPTKSGEPAGTVKNSLRRVWIMAGIVLVIGLCVVFGLRKYKRSTPPLVPVEKESIPAALTVNELLNPVYIQAKTDDKSFYTALQYSIWNFFSRHFNFTGSGMNKQVLEEKLEARGINTTLRVELAKILEECDTGIYTGVLQAQDRETTLAAVKDLLQKLQTELSQTG